MGLHYAIYRDYSTPLINRYKIEYYDADTGSDLTFDFPHTVLYSYTVWGAHLKARRAKHILFRMNRNRGPIDEGLI